VALAPGRRQGAEHRVPVLAQLGDERVDLGEAGGQRLGLAGADIPLAACGSHLVG